jgi:hypothetical protein
MHISKEVQAERYDDAEQYDACRKDIQHQAVTAYGIHESGAHLHADGVDEKNKAEFLDKVQDVSFDAEAEMSEQDAHEKRTCAAKADSLDLDFADHETDCRGKRDRHDLLPYRGLCE